MDNECERWMIKEEFWCEQDNLFAQFESFAADNVDSNVNSNDYWAALGPQENCNTFSTSFSVTPYNLSSDSYMRKANEFYDPNADFLNYISRAGSEYPALRQPPVKRRNTANRKERKRTQSINNAFSDLRDCIPNVPADTKLSKIKTLRLATSYISYLMNVLNNEDSIFVSENGFKADFSSHCENPKSNVNSAELCCDNEFQQTEGSSLCRKREATDDHRKKSKGRTGWPEHVWALELKEQV